VVGGEPAGDRSQALLLTNAATSPWCRAHKAPCADSASGNEIFTAPVLCWECDVATGIARALAEGSNDLPRLGRFVCRALQAISTIAADLEPGLRSSHQDPSLFIPCCHPRSDPRSEAMDNSLHSSTTKTLLIVYHSVTGGTRQMVEAAARGAAVEPAVRVRLLPAPLAQTADLSRRTATSLALPRTWRPWPD
jgi:hypothetical protein